jgi:hypothetical protein
MRLGRLNSFRELTVALATTACAIAFTAGCFGRSELDLDDELTSPHGTSGEGGSSAATGTGGHATGGTGRGGSPGTGARPSSGGKVGAGGIIGTGGVVGSGGFIGKGGFIGSGGRPVTGGVAGSGGFIETGGTGTGGAAGCGPANCMGCCTAGDVCVSGTGTNTCGMNGARCTDCGSSGFACDNGICQGSAPACAASCAGCCDALGRCRLGSELDACGVGGGACSVCSTMGLACTGGKCAGGPPACDATTCGGCCDARGICRPGSANTACGNEGESCQNCTSQGRTCSEPGSYCAFVPSCSSTTCPNGCCDASGVCHDGRADGACGTGGQACSNCAQAGQACAPSGFCYNGPHCGPDTCAGCCAADGACRPGSGPANCGSFGALCENCTSQNLVCQAGACGVRGATCPAPYPGCNPGVLTSPPTNGTSCRPSDLDAVQKACAGSGGGACMPALRTLLASNPGCFDCMQQFLYDGAVAKCLAPFLSPTCNHQFSCYAGCLSTSCGRCAAGDRAVCESGAADSTGECGSELSGAFCAQAAFSGPAGFCDLASAGDFGVWLRGVGAYYCSG